MNKNQTETLPDKEKPFNLLRGIREVHMEHGEWSQKRCIITLLTLCVIIHYMALVFSGPIEEGHAMLLGEMLSLIGFFSGLTVANKHKAFRKSTNTESKNEQV